MELARSFAAVRMTLTPLSRQTFPAARRVSARRGLGLIELLTLVAVLMIGLAMMVATARHVRSTSANELTRKRMRALADAAIEVIEKGADPTLPVPATAPGEPEDRIRAFARASSRRLDDVLAAGAPDRPAIADAIAAVAAGRPELDDAWGQPIALMPGQQPSLGMAPDDTPFLVSAGPDGRFLTLSDNIYSYDLPALLPKPGKRREVAATPP